MHHDHQFAGAHAHLKLVGWTTRALFGLYYRATPQAASTRLARVHLATATLGVLVMVPGIAIAVTSGASGLAAVGAIFTCLSMAIFLYTVIRNGFGQKIARAEGKG